MHAAYVRRAPLNYRMNVGWIQITGMGNFPVGSIFGGIKYYGRILVFQVSLVLHFLLLTVGMFIFIRPCIFMVAQVAVECRRKACGDTFFVMLQCLNGATRLPSQLV